MQVKGGLIMDPHQQILQLHDNSLRSLFTPAVAVQGISVNGDCCDCVYS